MTPTTIIALCEIMSRKEVAELAEVSLATIKNLVRGEQQLVLDPDDLDKDYIESLGFKICGCCGVRIVPKEPVDYQILTRLCVSCWEGESGAIDVAELNIVKNANLKTLLDK